MDSNIFLIKYEGYLDHFILERSFPTLVFAYLNRFGLNR